MDLPFDCEVDLAIRPVPQMLDSSFLKMFFALPVQGREPYC